MIREAKHVINGEVWSEKQFKDFVCSHTVLFIAFARRYLSDKSKAEDIVQDCLCKLWLKTSRSCDCNINNVVTYVLTMIKNSALNNNRDNARLVFSEWIDPDNYAQRSFVDRLASQQQTAMFEQIVDSLPSTWVCVMRKSLEGKSVRQIASDLNMSVDSVKAIKRRSMRRLMEITPQYLKIIYMLFCVLAPDLAP